MNGIWTTSTTESPRRGATWCRHSQRFFDILELPIWAMCKIYTLQLPRTGGIIAPPRFIISCVLHQQMPGNYKFELYSAWFHKYIKTGREIKFPMFVLTYWIALAIVLLWFDVESGNSNIRSYRLFYARADRFGHFYFTETWKTLL